MLVKKKILLIDDKSKFYKQIKKHFQDDFDIVWVDSEKKILTEINQKKYDLILSDLYLDNNRKATEFVEAIKDSMPFTPIVITSKENSNLIEFEINRSKNVDYFLKKSEFDQIVWKKIFHRLIDESKPPTVFISHSSIDGKFAEFIKDFLEKKGIIIKLNPIGIGEDIAMKILKGLKTSDKTIVILSEDAVKSDWVHFEMAIAFYLQVELNKDVLIPIKYKDCKFPMHFKRTLFLDWTKYKELEQEKFKELLFTSILKRTN